MSENTGHTDADEALQWARQLKTAHQALGVAAAAIADVIGGLADILTREHLTAECHAGRHDACPGACGCSDCAYECECTCHLVTSGLRILSQRS